MCVPQIRGRSRAWAASLAGDAPGAPSGLTLTVLFPLLPLQTWLQLWCSQGFLHLGVALELGAQRGPCGSDLEGAPVA